MALYIFVVLFCLATMSNAKTIWSLISYGTCGLCHSIDVKRDIEFHLYTRQNPETPYILEFENEINLADSPFHPEHHVIIYIHGYGESASTESANEIVKAYLKRNEYNMIVVDWRKLSANPWYYIAIDNTVIVGQHLANFVKWLKNQNRILISDLHVIGFSLGAHVAGFMGKELAPQKVGRITGLDPAAPGFTSSYEDERLDKSDATFVDIIHVSAKNGSFGIRIPLGHVDFYPNNGLEQPGCQDEPGLKMSCSHRRAWLYYAESVSNPRGFPASRCKTWDPIVNNCTENADAFMGFGVDENTRGIFLVQTNSAPPFAKYSNEYTNNKEYQTT